MEERDRRETTKPMDNGLGNEDRCLKNWTGLVDSIGQPVN